jgi:hypothetical protein
MHYSTRVPRREVHPNQPLSHLRWAGLVQHFQRRSIGNLPAGGHRERRASGRKSQRRLLGLPTGKGGAGHYSDNRCRARRLGALKWDLGIPRRERRLADRSHAKARRRWPATFRSASSPNSFGMKPSSIYDTAAPGNIRGKVRLGDHLRFRRYAILAWLAHLEAYRARDGVSDGRVHDRLARVIAQAARLRRMIPRCPRTTQRQQPRLTDAAAALWRTLSAQEADHERAYPGSLRRATAGCSYPQGLHVQTDLNPRTLSLLVRLAIWAVRLEGGPPRAGGRMHGHAPSAPCIDCGRCMTVRAVKRATNAAQRG